MASHGHMYHPGSRHVPTAQYAPPMAAGPPAPAGTFAPGTKIQVGSHRVVIQKYLSEGGFAHVYLVKMPKPVDGTDLAVLKRVAVPDKDTLRGMRIEVETMKKLKGHRPIVTYIDSHASELSGGAGYEVFLLMEYCDGGGLIDFMNTRLQHRLTEPEIISIFADIAEGVACMHYLKPPLLHRDIKVENVLIVTRGTKKRFKLCDFGSSAPPRAAPTTVTECRQMDEDIQKHTTLQYRSPEMVDVYRKLPMNEKCDIWALGVLLYKLCYYTTPFEDQGQLAILNASYRFHNHPIFSDRMKKLIASMLQEKMHYRPNIYQVLKEACAMQGREVPIHDIYSQRADAEPASGQANARESGKSNPVVGVVFTAPEQEKEVIPEVVPMRRGRPTSSVASSKGPKPSPSPMRVAEGDPFSALDSKARSGDADELSARFPTLDEFSILHSKNAKFDFDSNSPLSPPSQPPSDLNQRLTEHLADEAFSPPSTANAVAPRPHSTTPRVQPTVSSPSPPETVLTKTTSYPQTEASRDMSRAQSIISSNPELQAIAGTNPRYVSTGTMTGEFSPKLAEPEKDYERWNRSRPSHQAYPKPESTSTATIHPSRPTEEQAWRKSRTPSVVSPQLQSSQQVPVARAIAESSPSQVEQNRLPSRSSSIPLNRPRPVSTSFESSRFEAAEPQPRPQSRTLQQTWNTTSESSMPSPQGPKDQGSRDSPSDMEFLRSMESRDSANEEGVKQSKRSSLGSLSGSKHKLAGKFGDAFKRFEGHSNSSPVGARTPSPLKEMGRGLDPIEGSVTLDSRSDDGFGDESSEMTPEMRREVERRQLEEEERRVEAAQADFRRRAATGSVSSTSASRASSIQSRVQSLLNEDQRAAPVQRTAQGYGKYSDANAAAPQAAKTTPAVPRKPSAPVKPRMDAPLPVRNSMTPVDDLSNPQSRTQASPVKAQISRPPVSKKPVHLTGQAAGRAQTEREHLVAVDLPGQPVLDMSAAEKDSYLEDFSKRFPSLSSIEMSKGGSTNGNPS